MQMLLHMNGTKETQSVIRDATIIKKQRSNPTRKINHWQTKRPESKRMVEWSKDTPTSTKGEATDVY